MIQRNLRWFFAVMFLAALLAGRALAAGPCDRVVSYLPYPYPGSYVRQHEWRVFDPLKRTDRLFLAMPGFFNDVRWDTTYTTAFFSSGDSLYRVEWKFAAKPELIGRLPRLQDSQGWWFNRDSSCWQVAAMSAVGS